MDNLELIRPEPQDVAELGRICFEAFRQISEGHGFERDFPNADVGAKVIELILSLPGSFGVAARLNGKLAGSNFLLLSDEIAGVGPITVDPMVHGRGIGRQLMQAALEHARAQGAQRIRLMQDSYNTTSLSLYASLGFSVREPVGLMRAGLPAAPDPSVRPARKEDLPRLDELSRSLYGASRREELAAWLKLNIPVLVRDSSAGIGAYLALGKLGHGVAQVESDALAIIAQIGLHAAAGLDLFFCPLRNASLYRASLQAGCRLTKVMNLMTLGPYQDPPHVWMPSIAY